MDVSSVISSGFHPLESDRPFRFPYHHEDSQPATLQRRHSTRATADAIEDRQHRAPRHTEAFRHHASIWDNSDNNNNCLASEQSLVSAQSTLNAIDDRHYDNDDDYSDDESDTDSVIDTSECNEVIGAKANSIGEMVRITAKCHWLLKKYRLSPSTTKEDRVEDVSSITEIKNRLQVMTLLTSPLPMDDNTAEEVPRCGTSLTSLAEEGRLPWMQSSVDREADVVPCWSEEAHPATCDLVRASVGIECEVKARESYNPQRRYLFERFLVERREWRRRRNIWERMPERRYGTGYYTPYDAHSDHLYGCRRVNLDYKGVNSPLRLPPVGPHQYPMYNAGWHTPRGPHFSCQYDRCDGYASWQHGRPTSSWMCPPPPEGQTPEYPVDSFHSRLSHIDQDNRPNNRYMPRRSFSPTQYGDNITGCSPPAYTLPGNHTPAWSAQVKSSVRDGIPRYLSGPSGRTPPQSTTTTPSTQDSRMAAAADTITRASRIIPSNDLKGQQIISRDDSTVPHNESVHTVKTCLKKGIEQPLANTTKRTKRVRFDLSKNQTKTVIRYISGSRGMDVMKDSDTINTPVIFVDDKGESEYNPHADQMEEEHLSLKLTQQRQRVTSRPSKMPIDLLAQKRKFLARCRKQKERREGDKGNGPRLNTDGSHRMRGEQLSPQPTSSRVTTSNESPIDLAFQRRKFLAKCRRQKESQRSGKENNSIRSHTSPSDLHGLDNAITDIRHNHTDTFSRINRERSVIDAVAGPRNHVHDKCEKLGGDMSAHLHPSQVLPSLPPEVVRRSTSSQEEKGLAKCRKKRGSKDDCCYRDFAKQSSSDKKCDADKRHEDENSTRQNSTKHEQNSRDSEGSENSEIIECMLKSRENTISNNRENRRHIVSRSVVISARTDTETENVQGKRVDDAITQEDKRLVVNTNVSASSGENIRAALRQPEATNDPKKNAMGIASISTEHRHWKRWTKSLTSLPVNEKSDKYKLKERTENQSCFDVSEVYHRRGGSVHVTVTEKRNELRAGPGSRLEDDTSHATALASYWNQGPRRRHQRGSEHSTNQNSRRKVDNRLRSRRAPSNESNEPIRDDSCCLVVFSIVLGIAVCFLPILLLLFEQ